MYIEGTIEETKDFNKTTSAVANNQTSTSTGATKASAAVTVTTTATTHKISGNKKKMDHSDDSGKFSVHSRYNNASSNLIIESDNGDDDEELQENKQQQSDKGLAGLKKMERNVEDDFVIKSKSPQQQPHKGREASEAAEKASAMIFNYVGFLLSFYFC
ncbi:hypothetical protein HELRODRAFT_160334 [Helobdella robusta]|uniref:Uncharacterized protein n=1 Tax=Helobdella robusta TaxID=6412 RepID=T1EQ39_HELRO|nr:hypothetical protein HELRODRAFT_160334 [Helobdella robusta]ESO06181.1 hypothetical protein HELRODRAFT_160334 [Helobdella robusta]